MCVEDLVFPHDQWLVGWLAFPAVSRLVCDLTLSK